MRSILPDGKRIHYTRISPGTHWTDAVYEHTSPTAFYKSRVAWNGHGWDLTLKDGTVYVFGVETPLEAIRDRFGQHDPADVVGDEHVRLGLRQHPARGVGHRPVDRLHL